MFIDLPQRSDSRDAFLEITGQDGTLHISWLLNDNQIIIFEKEPGEQSNSALMTCSLQEYCRAMIKSKLIQEECVTKGHIIKLIDHLDFV